MVEAAGVLTRPLIFGANFGQILPCQRLTISQEWLLSKGERGSEIDSDFYIQSYRLTEATHDC